MQLITIMVWVIMVNGHPGEVFYFKSQCEAFGAELQRREGTAYFCEDVALVPPAWATSGHR